VEGPTLTAKAVGAFFQFANIMERSVESSYQSVDRIKLLEGLVTRLRSYRPFGACWCPYGSNRVGWFTHSSECQMITDYLQKLDELDKRERDP